MIAVKVFLGGDKTQSYYTRVILLSEEMSSMSRQTTKDSTLEHIYNNCETTSSWLQHTGPEGPMHLNSMLATVNATSENLKKLNWFVKSVKKVYTRRRYESSDGLTLSTLSLRELKRQVGEVQPLGRCQPLYLSYVAKSRYQRRARQRS